MMFMRLLRKGPVSEDKSIELVSQGATLLREKKLFVFLQSVMQGEEKQVASMVQSSPGLLFLSGKLTAHSGHSFENITALQYAVWALDAPMWRMLLQFMDKHEAEKQVRDLLGHRLAEHGHCVDFKPLLEAYEEYLTHYQQWDNAERNECWVSKIGVAQAACPDHILAEYATSGAFDPLLSFVSKPRAQCAKGYSVHRLRDGLSQGCVIMRYHETTGRSSVRLTPQAGSAYSVRRDYHVMQRLFEARMSARNELLLSLGLTLQPCSLKLT